jgi:hypothetical protein
MKSLSESAISFKLNQVLTDVDFYLEENDDWILI